MVKDKIYFTKMADKDKKLLKQAGLENKARELLKIIENHYGKSFSKSATV